MACEKYSDPITDLAAGGINPRRERELLLHAGECDVCREAYRHAKEVFAALDHSVETLVAGEPSPHFATRLRARIAEERRSASARWSSRALIVSGALVSSVFVLLLLSRSPLHVDSNPSAATNASAASTGVSGNESVSNLPKTLQNEQPIRDSRAARPRRLSQEVLVPRGQLAAALLLSDGVSGGRVDGEQVVAIQNETATRIEVKPLEIAPLESPHADTSGNDPTQF